MADRIRVEQKDAAPLRGRPWTRHYDPGVPATLEYPDLPLHAMLEDAARSHRGATATIFFGRKRSYGSLQRDATFFSAALRRLGVKQGDRVALMLPNCPQFLIAFFGALRLGAVVVPCDPVYTPREIQRQLADSGAETIVVLSSVYATVKAARTGTALRNVIVTEIKEEMPVLTRSLFTIVETARREGHRVAWRGDPGTHAFRELLVDAGEPVAAAVGPADLAVLQYTGGTTGTPKGAMLSHRALLANALQCRAWFTNLRDGADAIVGVMPFFHVYGLTACMGLAVQSASALILEPRFDLRRLLRDIQRYRPKIFPGAPRIYNAIVASPLAGKHDLRSIEACISGSAPLADATARRFAELTGGHLVEGYGLTEASPVTHCNPIFGTGKQKIGSIGVAFPDVECKVMDLETGTRDLRAGESGELVVRGPNLMDGYYERPEETAETIRDGWLHTGDVAYMDGEGYVFIVDRKKELIIVSGFNVYPREVEEALAAHDQVVESAAIAIPHEVTGEAVKAFVVRRAGAAVTAQELIIVSGFNVYPREVEEALAAHDQVVESAAIAIPHDVTGEAVKAFVVRRAGATVTADELIASCATSLAPFKVPREIEFRDALPKTLVGKVLRRQLAEEDRAARAAGSRD